MKNGFFKTFYTTVFLAVVFVTLSSGKGCKKNEDHKDKNFNALWTGDAGLHWELVNITGQSAGWSEIVAMAYLDIDQTLLAVSDRRIFLSTDGSVTWTDKNLPTGFNCYDIGTPGAMGRAFVVGWETSSAKMYSTTDKGDTWTAVNIPGTSSLFKIAFEKVNGVGIVVGAAGSIYKSDFVGNNWTPVTNPLGNTVDLYDLVFAGTNKLVACGSKTTGGGVVLVSNDLGDTWQEISSPLFNSKLSSIAAYDANKWVATTTGRHHLYTADGGATWSESSSEVEDGMVRFIGNAAVSVGLLDTHLSSDYGNSWSAWTTNDNPSFSPRGVFPWYGNTGFIFGTYAPF